MSIFNNELHQRTIDFNPEEDDTPEEYRLKLECYSDEDLIEETGTDEGYTLEEYMENFG